MGTFVEVRCNATDPLARRLHALNPCLPVRTAYLPVTFAVKAGPRIGSWPRGTLVCRSSDEVCGSRLRDEGHRPGDRGTFCRHGSVSERAKPCPKQTGAPHGMRSARATRKSWVRN